MLHSKYKELFQEKIVMTMEHLKLATGRPRESILRDLKSIGYYSSYNACGKFYTLDHIPKFDDLGLWKHQDAYFSSRQTVLDTAEYLVIISASGYTHDELRQILGIRIHNSLRQLVAADRIMRNKVGSLYVYFGHDNSSEQLKNRNSMPTVPVARKKRKRIHPDMKSELVIDVLIAILRGHETISSAHSHLNKIGSAITEQQVMTVFHHYDIGKKNSSIQK